MEVNKMINEYITIVVSLLAFFISIINSFKIFKQILSYRELKDVHRGELSLKSFENELKNVKGKDAELYLEKITSILKEIYPKCSFTISVMLVEKSDKQNPSDSEVITWISYPKEKYNIKMSYRVKDNTDFSSIVDESKKYFFVSDLKEYSALKGYKNSDTNFLQEYKSSIVVPIQKDENILGFMCINSSDNLGNVKKNRKLVDVVKSVTSLLCDYLIENKLTQEAITIKE